MGRATGIVVLILLVASALLQLAPGTSAESPVAPRSTHAVVSVSADSASPVAPLAPPSTLGWNLTMAPRAPSTLAASSSSVDYAEPSPPVPATTPVVLTLESSSRNTTYSQNITAPAGTWARIILNYSGGAFVGVFDSSYRGYLDKSLVLLGTTPEYAHWTVLKDLTEYSALFHGTFNLTFLLGAAVSPGGYFTTSLTLLFYPVPGGSAPPAEPTGVVPLWYRLNVLATSPVVYVDTTLPSNVTNATFELYTYGINADEFWYTLTPPLRELQIASNGTRFLTVLPFQYINTGGIDLFTWRPITGAFTLNDRPYQFNVTGALGLLEGPHNLSITVSGFSAGSAWFVGGSLLYTTAAAAGPATAGGYSLSAPSPSIVTSGSSYNESATVSIHSSSDLPLPSGTANVTMWTNASFFTHESLVVPWLGANWTNITGDERVTTTSRTVLGNSSSVEVRVLDFPIAMDHGTAFVVSSSNHGTYPIFGNRTSYLDNLHEEWNESTTASGSNLSDYRSQRVDDRVTTGLNELTDYEEETGPSAGILFSYSFVESQTTKLYAQESAAPAGGGSYSHLLIGAAFLPTDPNLAETILADVVSSPLSEQVLANHSAIDEGQSVSFVAIVSGGFGPYTFSWFGLPPGCPAANQATISCTPRSSGFYEAGVGVTDSRGTLAPTATTPLLVSAALKVAVTTDLPAIDVGGSLVANATVAGGTGAVTCRWTVTGGTWGAAVACNDSFVFRATALGRYVVSVQATDALGVSTISSPGAAVNVTNPPSVSLEPPSPNATTVGHPVEIIADTTGGAGALTYTWFENGSALPGVFGRELTFVPSGAGTYLFSVGVVDSAGGVGSSENVSVEVGPASQNSPGTGTPSTGGLPGGLDWTAYLAIGLGVGLLAGIVLMTLLSPRRTPPRRRAPPRQARPVNRRPPPPPIAPGAPPGA